MHYNWLRAVSIIIMPIKIMFKNVFPLLQGQPVMSKNHSVISRLMFVLDDWLGVVLLIIMLRKHSKLLCFPFQLQARAIMNENHSAITRLMYQLFIALGKKNVSSVLDQVTERECVLQVLGLLKASFKPK